MEPVAWHDSLPFMWTLLTALVAAAFAAGGAKRALNGTRERVKEIHEQLHAHISEEHNADQQTHARLGTLEGKVDVLIERIK